MASVPRAQGRENSRAGAAGAVVVVGRLLMTGASAPPGSEFLLKGVGALVCAALS